MATNANVGVGELVDGKYRLLRVIGEGGWGIVYEGENVRTLKRVAIKILRARADLTADIRTRFEREAQAAGRIGSEHIVEVFDLGTLADGSHYMVMELLSGCDLSTRLRNNGALDSVTGAKVVLQLLEGLAAAHDAGIMHRDLKPENLFLVPTRSGEDFVKILDFGISKFTSPGMSSATMTGAVLGSPCYMAPEQARGLKNVDPRTDLYSVGTLLFECVTGRVPFDGDNFNDLMFKIALAPRPNPLEVRPDLDHGMAAIIVKAIQAEPNERFQNAEQFREALTQWLEAQGVDAFSTPELRRGRHTPRTSGRLTGTPTPSTHHGSMPHLTPGGRPTSPSGHSIPGTPSGHSGHSGHSGQHSPMHWSGATQAAESSGPPGSPGPGPTPLAASATMGQQGGEKKQQGKALAFVLVGGLVAAAAIGVAIFTRHPQGPAAAAPPPSASAEAIAATTPPAAPPPPAPIPASPAPDSTVASADDQVALTPPPPATVAAHGGQGLRNQPAARPAVPQPTPHGAATPKGPGPAAPPAPEPVVAAPPPAPAPTPPPAKTVESVEGRAIQTGL
jgi:eukaryotic-like serine/threonine-protein kinase